MKGKELPEPECELGYTLSQLVNIMGDRIREFDSWLSGQTVALCDGRAYDPQTEEYYNTGCGPHGSVVYYWDVKRFLDGEQVVD